MKKILITLAATMLIMVAQAQEGEILYTDFDPDITLTQMINTNDTLSFDVDQDGSIDLKCFLYIEEHGFEMPYFQATNGWELSLRLDFATVLNSDTLKWYTYDGWGPWNGVYYGLRKTVGIDCYYGWIFVYDGQTKTPNRWGTLFIDRMAYCTIPNYPLRVGQTDFDWDVEESQNTVVATIHPNPSSGMVIITGEDLKEAVVFNSIGQKVATAKGEGGQLSIDLTKTTSGIYFVSITDKNGKKGVKKVVKR